MRTEDEKRQLLENLDIEVENQKRKYEQYLEELLLAFTNRQEAIITRIPKAIRQMTLREFDKYGGSVRVAVQAMMQQSKAEGQAQDLERKRKWQAAIHEGQQTQHEERAPKNARLLSPTKPSAFNKTPKANRTATTSTNKTPSRTGHKPKENIASTTKGRGLSPTKSFNTNSTFRVPSASSFNPVIPKTPIYPRRFAKKNESVMSLNGTPIALPFEDVIELGESAQGKSGIVVRRDPSYNPSVSIASSSTAVSGTGPTITLSTHRGQLLQFDPLAISPSSFDKLPGLTESAKKQAKDEMARIVQNLQKWQL